MSSCMPRWQECQEDFQSFFPEEASSRESWQLLVFSYRGTLTVGFGLALSQSWLLEAKSKNRVSENQ